MPITIKVMFTCMSFSSHYSWSCLKVKHAIYLIDHLFTAPSIWDMVTPNTYLLLQWPLFSLGLHLWRNYDLWITPTVSSLINLIWPRLLIWMLTYLHQHRHTQTHTALLDLCLLRLLYYHSPWFHRLLCLCLLFLLSHLLRTHHSSASTPLFCPPPAPPVSCCWAHSYTLVFVLLHLAWPLPS